MDSNQRQIVMGANSDAGAAAIAADIQAQAVSQVSAKINEDLNGRPFRFKPNGDIEIVEKLLPQPVFRRGKVTFHEAVSFALFVARFRNTSTVIFANEEAVSLTAALDYHPPSPSQESAAWDLFRAELPLAKTAKTDSWQEWEAFDGKPTPQIEFAQFLEDHIPDIAEPAGAVLVEIARTLEAKADVSFQSHFRADNGSHAFSFVESVTGTASTAASGKVTIPAELTLALEPFQGAGRYVVKARLRYRIVSGKLSIWYDLVRPDDVIREAFRAEVGKVDGILNPPPSNNTEASRTPIFFGPAPAANELQG